MDDAIDIPGKGKRGIDPRCLNDKHQLVPSVVINRGCIAGRDAVDRQIEHAQIVNSCRSERYPIGVGGDLSNAKDDVQALDRYAKDSVTAIQMGICAKCETTLESRQNWIGLFLPWPNTCLIMKEGGWSRRGQCNWNRQILCNWDIRPG